MKQQDVEEEQEERKKNNKKTYKIGCLKNGRMNFDKDEQFFSQTYASPQVLEKVKVVKDFIDPDILELRKKQWNASVSCPKNNQQEETFERKLIKIRLGLIDRPIPKQRERFIEPGCDTRNDYTSWNVSTEQYLQQRKQQLEEQTLKALEMTKIKRERVLKNYITNEQHQINLVNNLRQQKIEEKPIRDQIRQDYKFQFPAASQEKTDAAVFRINYERKLAKKQKNQEEQMGEMKFKPDCSLTLKNIVKIVYQHTGSFQNIGLKNKSNGEEEDEELQNVGIKAWSCCMNEDINSQGCNKFKVDKNSWNYASIQEY